MPQRARPRSPLGATLATGLTGIARKPSASTGYPTRGMQPAQPQPVPTPMPTMPLPILNVGQGQAPMQQAAPPASYAAPTFNVGQPTNPVPLMTTGTTDMFSSAPMQPPMMAGGSGALSNPLLATVQPPMQPPMAGSQIGSINGQSTVQGTGATSGLPHAGSDANGQPIFYNATSGMYVDSSGTGLDPDTISNWQPNMDPRSIAAANNPGGFAAHPGRGLAQGINALANPGNFGTTQIP